ncbi:uncharacterized protein LOC142950942 isoform X2 [Anarhichas minor]|uniref:uncharacterized protein LOC142950942 isoform X2 n=1 Tax=Anarhichas minor TaxID=65739 RepID=UPI003F741C6D
MGNKPSAKPERNQVVRSLSVWHLPPPEEEKCYDFPDASLTFVDEDDVLDFLCADYKSRRAKMSCGHAVTPMSLTHWCRRQLDKGGWEFVCGQTGCDVEWPFEECPGCKSRVVRTDLNNQSVQCTVCTARRGRTYTFCWQCLKEWRGLTWSGDCGNDDCHNPLEILKSCPDITFKDVRGVTGCPSVRACPTCGLLVEHNTTKCKNIVCGRCKVEFCFVCLKLTEECLRLKPSSHYYLCSSGVAPRQTSIPVWQRR